MYQAAVGDDVGVEAGRRAGAARQLRLAHARRLPKHRHLWESPLLET